MNLQHQHKTSHFQLLASRHDAASRPVVGDSFLSLSFFPFLFYLIFFSSCYFDYVIVTSMPFPCCFRFVVLLRGYFFFLVWLYSVFFEGRRILGYSGRTHSTPWKSLGFQDQVESSNPRTRTVDGSPGFGSLNLWILEILENSELSRSPSPTILRHSIFGILNLQILCFSNPWILRSPRS